MDLSHEELKEVIGIFRAESSQYIQQLNDGLLALEKGDDSTELIANLFRTAHSIKGAARMLGLLEIERIAHRLEDFLGLIKNGLKKISASEFDVLYKSIDMIAVITDELSDSGTIQTNIDAILEQLKILGGNKEEKIPVKNEITDKLESGGQENGQISTSEGQDINENEDEKESDDVDAKSILLDWQKDQSIRIETIKLDVLLNRSSELLTTLSKQDEIGGLTADLLSNFQKWYGEWERHKFVWDQIEQNLGEFGEMPSPDVFTDEIVKKIFSLALNGVRNMRQLNNQMNYLNNSIYEDNIRSRFIVENLEREVKEIRMLPIANLFKLLPRMVRDLARSQSKEIDINLEGLDTQVDKQIIEELKDPIVHILRNAVDHGIEYPEARKKKGKSAIGSIKLAAFYDGSNIVIEISDDGDGINTELLVKTAVKKKIVDKTEIEKFSETEKINLIFRPGFSTSKIITDLSGRGVGLDVVRENVEKLKGHVQVITEKGKGTKFILRLPLTIGTTQILIVSVGDLIYAIPVHSILRLHRVTREEIQEIAGKTVIENEGEAVILTDLKNLLQSPKPVLEKKIVQVKEDPMDAAKSEKKFPVIILESLNRKAAIVVDDLLDEQNVVVKAFGARLGKIQNIMGIAVLANGELANVLNPTDLIDSVHQSVTKKSKSLKRGTKKVESRRILVVDDSITTRTLEKNILDSAGFDVSIAINGVEAWNKLESQEFDLVVSDVEMPEMDGFELIKKMRADPKYKELPTILVTSLQSPEDRMRGEEVGADAYITKGTFDQIKLLDTINELIQD